MSDEFKVSREGICVTCDMCEEIKAPALKTCLKCELSMCSKHLQEHLTSSVLLRTHPLTEPVPLAGAGQKVSKCSTHGKLMEYYCLDDRVFACMACAIEDKHHLHNMKMLQTAHKELTENLRVKSKTLADRQKQSKELESWHRVQRQTLENCISQLTKTGSALRDLVLTSVETSVSARLGAIMSAQLAASSALKEEDKFIFLQKFASVHQAVEEASVVDLRPGLEDRTDSNKLIKEIRQLGRAIEKQMHRLQREYLAFVDPENQQDPQHKAQPSSELTFDPKTLGPGMTLSEDHKTVFFSPATTNLKQLTQLSRALQQAQSATASQWNQPSVSSQLSELSRVLQQTQISVTSQLNQPPRTFHHNNISIPPCLIQTVCCLQTNTRGTMRWIIHLFKHFNWTVGICDENATNGNYSEVYGLKVKDETLSSLETVETVSTSRQLRLNSQACFSKTLSYRSECPILEKFHVTYPLTLEVIWDCHTQLLNFYSRNKLTEGFLLLKLKINPSRFVLRPFFTIEPRTSNPTHTAHRTQISENKAAYDNSYTEILCQLK